MQQKQTNPTETTPQKPVQPQPAVNERGSLNVSGYIRVFDPNSQETLVEARE